MFTFYSSWVYSCLSILSQNIKSWCKLLHLLETKLIYYHIHVNNIINKTLEIGIWQKQYYIHQIPNALFEMEIWEVFFSVTDNKKNHHTLCINALCWQGFHLCIANSAFGVLDTFPQRLHQCAQNYFQGNSATFIHSCDVLHFPYRNDARVVWFS